MSDLLGMHRAVMRSTRSTTEKIVLLAIIDHWSEASPEPWPSVPTLSKLCSLGRTAVLDALAVLERDGVVAVRTGVSSTTVVHFSCAERCGR
jgi:DNA-binding FadR family transcriptional regulator